MITNELIKRLTNMIFYQLSLGLILTLPWIYFRNPTIEMGAVIVIQLCLINIAIHLKYHHYIADIKKMLNKVNDLEKLINNIKGTNETN